MERISLLESELESEKEKGSTMDEQVALMEKSYELAAKYMGGQNGTQTAKLLRSESREEQSGTRQAGGTSGGILARTACRQCGGCRHQPAGA